MARNAHAVTLERLGESILSGGYPVGSTLPPEPLLCEAFQVSRTVVREAIKSLVAKGLLVTGPKRGTRVLASAHWNWFDPEVIAWQSRAGLTPDFIRDLQELRLVVEPAAVRMAAVKANALDIAELEEAFRGMHHAVEEGGDYVTHDLRFHQGLLQASHNRMLIQMGRALSALLRTSFELSTRVEDGPRASLPMHRAVLDAVVAHAPDRAERALMMLINAANADIDRVLDDRAYPVRGRPAHRQPAHA
jgi:DNA-binding FadR family transcriptional regulator